MPLVGGLIGLFICLGAGDGLVALTGLPVPGSVLGMLLLLIFLMIKGEVPSGLRQVSEGLLKYLSLLYVPAGVGMMMYFNLIRADFWPLMAASLISTVVMLVVSAGVMSRLDTHSEHDHS
ncbi:hypothetical protein B9G99_06190 [Kushneria konosiri]|uniref:CidA/LrgA family protein n=2 Tax=Kushneria TaxID=504090 RepID=A0A240UUC0_9GAMM|nr:hypothetical protein B9G99_06190 [Kushneria konosiri]ART64683.1 hypothetical protein B9H00_08940 [Kushneria marisflavi]